MNTYQVANDIEQSNLEYVVWTGGEPLLQINDITKVIEETQNRQHHLETNGDLLYGDTPISQFDYVAISPKDIKTIKRLELIEGRFNMLGLKNYDIKVVTDLDLNRDLIPYATMLMPLTTGDAEKDLKVQQEVWNYCVEHIIKYTPRIHRDVWGQKKGI